MIAISDKHKCVGCRACEQICPRGCIEMLPDDEGFIYPKLNLDKCIDCHLCEKVCPVLTPLDGRNRPIKVYGCKSKDKDIQLKSSSGGAFSVLADSILSQGGLIFGAIFDESFKVVHSCTDRKERIDAFRRSKYVQSDTLHTFTSVKEALSSGREVLFCGTPCQIKGLKLFLQKPFDNLTTVDIICHGVPSPKVWHDYIDALGKKMGSDYKLSSVNFRSKKAGGWKRFAIELVFSSESGKSAKRVIQHPRDNTFYQLFFQNISLRPACYQCPAKGFTSGSDLTLADFWGIEKTAPQFDDDNGVSLVFVNTRKGSSLTDALSIERFEVSIEEATKHNPSAYNSVPEPAKRKKFFQARTTFTMRHMNKYSGMDLYGRARRRIIELIVKVIKR